MKIVHTADWHLGRTLHGVSLLEDQKHALEQLIVLLRAEKPDLLIVAGDIYDRAIPPIEAVEYFDSILTVLAHDLEQPSLFIAGNHDSAERLNFGRTLFGRQNLHFVNAVRDSLDPLRFTDSHGEVEVFAFPFCEPNAVRDLLEDDSIRGQESATAALIEAALPRSTSTRRVAVAHPFVTGGRESESERPLSVGTAASVPHTVFDPFCYAALGHLHSPQHVGRPEVRYAGSPCKYSFSEEGHAKGFTIVTIGVEGTEEIRSHGITLLHEMRTIEGRLEDLINRGLREGKPLDHVRAVITDAELQFNAMGRLREGWPNILTIQRRPDISALESGGAPESAEGRASSGPRENIGAFFRYISGREPSAIEQAVIAEILGEVNAQGEVAG